MDVSVTVRTRRALVGVLASIALAPAGFIVACSSSGGRSGFLPEIDASTEASDPFATEAGQPLPGIEPPCVGLGCKIVDCGAGKKTSLRGTVYDPAGLNPLYNAMVYIPSGEHPNTLPPLKDATVEPTGIACETCASVVVNPLRSVQTNAAGEFILEDVPVDNDVPIVVQIGKWRRLHHVDVTTKCEENKVRDVLRLPTNGDEGDLPQIAVTTGEVDAFECILRGIGIDDKEFVSGHGGAGHVHMFKGEGGGMGTPAENFWNDPTQLRKYDVVLLSCEGEEHNETKGGTSPNARGSMHEYLNAGGKVFATHFHYTWFKNSPHAEFRQVADWGESASATDYDIDQTFPKGAKFAEWLQLVGASKTAGKIHLENVANSVKAAKAPATTWIKAPNGDAKYLSFNTPISAPADKQCGRAVFSDVHLTDISGTTSISECGISSGSLNNQQKAIEFLFFDLSACVTDDRLPPPPLK